MDDRMAATQAGIDDKADADVMEQYGITFDGLKYRYAEYSYEKLKDAVNYAARQPRKHETVSAGVEVSILGGSGWPLFPGQQFTLVPLAETLTLRPRGEAKFFSVEIKDLVGIEISGPGSVATNAGLVGGGYGMESAAIGIFAAKIVNAVTTRVTTNTFLRLATDDGEVFLHAASVEPMELRLLLSAAIVKADASKRRWAQLQNSLSSEIRELHKLKDSGLLSDEEFQLLKKKLFG